ncbi:hypothetical protein K491DRAFT_707283 [Lophiostoma macrostomum CBS 122681]|uniref:Nucleic acid-binding protein n=1 Tax=Lophiostoma macrostomum CBS 122681 TaxID=1314788 RepID=A0A6A6STX0_9PLEO|nr:hypothetical protein K491DRAFT_707283 [Lophiostoma macrostomum CBS 122681]
MRLKTLNGAPLSEHLDFSAEILLKSDDLEASIRNFLDGNVGSSLNLLPSDEPASASELPPDDTYLDDTTRTLEQYPTQARTFLEHSLILHDTLLSSQVAMDPDTDSQNEADQTVSSNSFLSTGSSFDSFNTNLSEPSQRRSQFQAPVLQLPERIVVTSLDNLPSVKHVQSIYPATPTAILLCTVTERLELREVTTRKSGQRMLLQEMVVADETRSNFRVSFWFRPQGESNSRQAQQQQELGKTIDHLQLGDIVLLRNIVLSIFRDTLHGQSLRPSINKARTTVEVLRRADGSFGYRHVLPVAVDQKFVKVKGWARGHVAGVYQEKKRLAGPQEVEVAHGRPAKRMIRMDDELPPDTLEAV